MAETEEALRAEVLGVCRIYCDQVWDEALNRTGVESSSMLRKAKNIYYSLAIRVSTSSSSKLVTPFEVAEPEKHNFDEVPPPPNSPSKLAEHPKAGEKEIEATKEATPEINVSSAVPQDPSTDKEDTIMEIIWASLPTPTKGDSKGATQGSSEVAAQQTIAPPPRKIVIKKK